METLANADVVELSEDELMMVDGGGWEEFGQALGGTLMIAAAPITLVGGVSAGNPITGGQAAKKMVKDGWGMIETASENAY